ncbi:AAEL017288-PA [Aedes aegypti]|uniref:AAEL017288-PA n=1 Tax=Aedes aegypti TaxID=7159 RepID=J9E9K5_AEDAE|nr:AAEL017288-PA [Aedes aegypti]
MFRKINQGGSTSCKARVITPANNEAGVDQIYFIAEIMAPDEIKSIKPVVKKVRPKQPTATVSSSKREILNLDIEAVSPTSKPSYTTGRGNNVLIFQGHRYIKNNAHSGKIYWKSPFTTALLHQFQSQPLLASPQFSFKTSQRSGRHLLVVNGVTFFRNRHRNNKQYWKCNQYYKCKCPCIVVIDEINSRMNVKHIHNHETSGGGSARTSNSLPPMMDLSATSALAGSFLNDTLLGGKFYERKETYESYLLPKTAMEIARFGISQRGAKKLICHGYEYVKDRDFPDSTNWRCALFRRQKCRARAITKIIDGITYVRLTNDAHCHDVRMYRVFEPAVFGTTRRGQQKLIHNGHAYTKDRQSAKTCNWKCSLFTRYKCKARAVTRDINGVVYVKVTNTLHYHPVEQYKINYRRLGVNPMALANTFMPNVKDESF